MFACQSTISSRHLLLECFCNGKYDDICIIKIFSWMLNSPLLSNVVWGFIDWEIYKTSIRFRPWIKKNHIIAPTCSKSNGGLPTKQAALKRLSCRYGIELHITLAMSSSAWWRQFFTSVLTSANRMVGMSLCMCMAKRVLHMTKMALSTTMRYYTSLFIFLCFYAGLGLTRFG